ncbi:MAG: hypothetical protein IH853_12140 [Bacteroidetes bacterium]|nr:hypothetical protein [Bacteroidota bacterium]
MFEDDLKPWKDRLTLSDPRLVDRYVGLDVDLIVRYFWPQYGRDYVAVFKPLPTNHNVIDPVNDNMQETPALDNVLVRLGMKPIIGDSLTDNFTQREGGHNEFVLVVDVELVEPPQRIIRSLIWLLPCDDFERGITRAIYCMPNSGFVTIGRSVPENGEAVPLFDLLAVMNHKRTNSMIERRSKIVDSIAKDQGNIAGDLYSDAENVIGVPIVLKLGDNFIDVTPIKKAGDEGVQILDVLFGPFNLSKRDGKWVGSHAPKLRAG